MLTKIAYLYMNSLRSVSCISIQEWVWIRTFITNKVVSLLLVNVMQGLNHQ